MRTIFQQKLTQDFKPDILKSCKNCKSILIHDFCPICDKKLQNIQFYDKLIQFSRINHIKINIITFKDCESRISVLGKFSRGTGGFLSITTDAIQLETCMEKLVKSTVNYSQSTKFSLIYDEKEANFDNLTHFEQSKVSEISVTDKSEKWLFGVKVRDPNLKEIVYQLKVYDSNKLRVLTEKKEIINSQIRFVDWIHEESTNLFNTMIVTLITNQIIYLNKTNIDIKYYKELYERFGLDASILSELVSSIEILKQKQTLENLNDKEAS
jgi:hypothetical protein